MPCRAKILFSLHFVCETTLLRTRHTKKIPHLFACIATAKWLWQCFYVTFQTEHWYEILILDWRSVQNQHFLTEQWVQNIHIGPIVDKRPSSKTCKQLGMFVKPKHSMLKIDFLFSSILHWHYIFLTYGCQQLQYSLVHSTCPCLSCSSLQYYEAIEWNWTLLVVLCILATYV